MKKIISHMLVATAVLMVSALPASATLVTNGGFEDGDFTGWTQSGNLASTTVGDSNAHSGTYAAWLGPVGSDGFLSQDLVTTPGQLYKVSLWLSNSASGTNNFAVSFGGLTASIYNANPFAYTQWWFITQATSPLTTLTLGFRNDPYFFFLDDVDVSPVPIPGAVWLLGSGIVGLIGLKRRMRK